MDDLNAEIVLGTVRNWDEAVQWLRYTYKYTIFPYPLKEVLTCHINIISYVHMLKLPMLYYVSTGYQEDDPGLVQKRADIIHSVAVLLEKCNLVKYEHASGCFQSPEHGWIASHYYVTYNLMSIYSQHLQSTMSQPKLFCMFALSNEFKLIPIWQEVCCSSGKVGTVDWY